MRIPFRVFVVLFVASLLCPVLANAMSGTEGAESASTVDYDPHGHATVEIPASFPGTCEYRAVYYTNTLYTGDGIYGGFEVTYPASGADQIVDFFMCDEENYELWQDGQEATLYNERQNEDSYY
jgi:hypothetical protein